MNGYLYDKEADYAEHNVRKKEVHTYMCEFDVRQRSVFIVNGNALHGIESGVLSIYYLAKNGVF
jgi:hypothetical protein